MRAKRNITPEEVRNAKLLLSKGLSDAEVAAIIGRSVSAVVNIRNGAYDFMLEDKITQKLERLVRMMAKLWAQEIMFAETMEDAKALYERCPRLLKEKVKAILIKSGFEEITQ